MRARIRTWFSNVWASLQRDGNVPTQSAQSSFVVKMNVKEQETKTCRSKSLRISTVLICTRKTKYIQMARERKNDCNSIITWKYLTSPESGLLIQKQKKDIKKHKTKKTQSTRWKCKPNWTTVLWWQLDGFLCYTTVFVFSGLFSVIVFRLQINCFSL